MTCSARWPSSVLVVVAKTPGHCVSSRRPGCHAEARQGPVEEHRVRRHLRRQHDRAPLAERHVDAAHRAVDVGEHDVAALVLERAGPTRRASRATAAPSRARRATGSSARCRARPRPPRDPERVGEHRARRPVEVALGHPPEQHDVAAGRDVPDEPLLHDPRQVAPRPDEHRRPRRRVAPLEMRCAVTEPAEQQRARQRLALARAAVRRQVVDDLRHHARSPGWWYSVMYASSTSPSDTSSWSSSIRASHGSLALTARTACARRLVGVAALPLRADRRRRAVPLAGEADPVVAVADALVERRVDAAGEEVVVDEPVALGEAEPRLEVGRRRVVLHLRAGAVVARTRPRTRATSAAGRRRAPRP